MLGLGAFAEKYVRELSTGSRRVVDLACVLAHRPQVLLLDEPSSGIAQREAEALGPLLLRIREMTGASLLIIEHDVPLLTTITDRMIALDLGRVVTVGTADRGHQPPRRRGVLPRRVRGRPSRAADRVPCSPDTGRFHPMADSNGSSSSKALKRYGPIAAVVVRGHRRHRHLRRWR